MKILGTGSALPRLRVDNQMLSTFLDTNDEWIVSHTGIHSRQIMTDETLTELGAQAAEQALACAGLGASDVDYLICSTVQGDTVTPSLGCLLQARLNAPCAAIDLNGGCAGFVYALDMADAYISSGKARRVLVVASEAMSRLCDWTDRSTCVLFGDGAGAVVVGPGEGLLTTHLTSEGGTKVLNAYPAPGNSPFRESPRPQSGLYMAGPEVYKFAVSRSLRDLALVVEEARVTPDEVDFFLLHQANKRILDAVRARLKQPEEKFPSNIAVRGNTSSACVPILLDEMNRAGQLKPGMLLALSAFGAGLTTGAAMLRWNP